MKRRVTLGSRAVFAMAIVCQLMVFGLELPSHAQEFSAQCEGLKTKWEGVVQDLSTKLQEYEEIHRCPLEKVVNRPLVDFSSGKSIAKQISEAIQAKESLLSANRKLCQDILRTEAQVYNELEQCVRTKGNDKQGKLLKKIEKSRKQVVEKARLAVVEVREVEGHETAGYSQAYQSPYGRDNGYWQQYQQMYRGYWGR